MININLIQENFWFVFSGISYTLGITAVGFTTGLLFGFLLSRLRESRHKALSFLARFYVSLMRGVPMIVILFMLYFALPYLGIEWSALTCAFIAFGLVSSAYISEIFRSAMSAIDLGQWEAARALGLPQKTIVRKIILPQAIRIAIPPLGNVLIDMVKSTSLAAMISVPDIFQNAKIVGGREWDFMSMYILVALIYWGLTTLFETCQSVLEKRLGSY